MNLHQIARQLLTGKFDLDDAIDAIADLAVDASRELLARQEGLLRWFAADCAQRVFAREEAAFRRPPPEARDAIDIARRMVLGETESTQLAQISDTLKAVSFAPDASLDEEDDLPSLTLHEMAWLSARDTFVSMAQGGPCRDAAKLTSTESANEAAWTASLLPNAGTNKRRIWAQAQGDEFSWQCFRLAYLCEVWATCGERAPQLLFHDTCPLPAPLEAAL